MKRRSFENATNPTTFQWGRMALALCVTLLMVAGSGLALAAGPDPTYVAEIFRADWPDRARPRRQGAQYTLRVTFSNNHDAGLSNHNVEPRSPLRFMAVH